jgi:hypothetical protein
VLERKNDMLNNTIKVLVILVLIQWLWINIDETIYSYYDAKYELEIQGLYTDVYDNIDKKEQLEK